MAFSMVISSVYSMSLLTRMPMAGTRDFLARSLEWLQEIEGRGFAFDCGIGGKFAMLVG